MTRETSRPPTRGDHARTASPTRLSWCPQVHHCIVTMHGAVAQAGRRYPEGAYRCAAPRLTPRVCAAVCALNRGSDVFHARTRSAPATCRRSCSTTRKPRCSTPWPPPLLSSSAPHTRSSSVRGRHASRLAWHMWCRWYRLLGWCVRAFASGGCVTLRLSVSFRRCNPLSLAPTELVERRGGGAPFCVDVVRDGLRVGRLTGQVAMHSFDELREKVCAAPVPRGTSPPHPSARLLALASPLAPATPRSPLRTSVLLRWRS